MNKKVPVWNERWHLAALSREELVRIGLVAVMIGLAFVLFHFQGNTTNLRLYGRSCFVWMVGRWRNMGGDFSHGWLIPLVSIWVVWLKRDELARAPKSIDWRGLVVVAGALLLHWLGAKAQQTRISLMAFITLLWGVPFYIYGWQVARLLIFPCSYLFFCIPLNFLDTLTFPLRMIMTVISTHLLNGLGILVARHGSAIYSLSGGFDFDVAAPCSGLRSLLAMTALTAVYAYLTQKTLLRKWILFLCCVPLAIIGNIARITTVGLVAEAFGERLATGIYHDYSGYVVFGVAIALMVAVGSLLNMNYKEVWRQWKHAYLDPISTSSS